MAKHDKSLREALETSQTLYYASGEKRAYYQEEEDGRGTVIVNGRILTMSDVTENDSLYDHKGEKTIAERYSSNEIVLTKRTVSAEKFFARQGVDPDTGWDTRP